ncbi:MAG: metal-dependent hydrolase [Polyangiales bacterium]
MQTTHESSGDRPIRPRSPRFDFREVPRFWLASSGLATHIVNGANLLFPSGERFFVRSVWRYVDRVTDPAELNAVRAFCQQEGRHAKAHEDWFTAMRAQGYDVDGFLKWYERLAWETLEPRFSRELALAVTAALEHYTAIMAEGALSDGVLDHAAHPVMRDLLLWHAAEEIEHRAVAFDVLQKVDPRYRTRVLGMVVATLGLAAFWGAATGYLVYQDAREGRPLRAYDLETMRQNPRHIGRDVFLRGLREYFERDFHPLKRDCLDLARRYLVDAGLEPA